MEGASMMIQASVDEDWCHLCGFRTSPLVGISYSKNAENDKGDTSKYIRICRSCVTEAMIAIQNTMIG